jgi:chorismate mutase
MNLCNYNHDEICFDGRKCPFCEKVSELDAEIADRDRQISSLNDERAGLISEVTALQAQLDSFTDC